MSFLEGNPNYHGIHGEPPSTTCQGCGVDVESKAAMWRTRNLWVCLKCFNDIEGAVLRGEPLKPGVTIHRLDLRPGAINYIDDDDGLLVTQPKPQRFISDEDAELYAAALRELLARTDTGLLVEIVAKRLLSILEGDET